jgi:addiction module HigA family antidote
MPQETCNRLEIWRRHDPSRPLQVSQHKLAMDIHVPATRIGEIVHGRRAVTPETALRLGHYFGTSAEFWLNLQQNYDLSKARIREEEQIVREVRAYVSQS